VVVNDVEDHLETGLVEQFHHPFEFANDLDRIVDGGVLVVRREESVRVIAPVVPQALCRSDAFSWTN
jgi:hypothetical protein